MNFLYENLSLNGVSNDAISIPFGIKIIIYSPALFSLLLK